MVMWLLTHAVITVICEYMRLISGSERVSLIIGLIVYPVTTIMLYDSNDHLILVISDKVH